MQPENSSAADLTRSQGYLIDKDLLMYRAFKPEVFRKRVTYLPEAMDTTWTIPMQPENSSAADLTRSQGWKRAHQRSKPFGGFRPSRIRSRRSWPRLGRIGNSSRDGRARTLQRRSPSTEFCVRRPLLARLGGSLLGCLFDRLLSLFPDILRDRIPLEEGKPHPIPALMAKARKDWEQLKGRQSKNFAAKAASCAAGRQLAWLPL
jgi:hypothetical protein